MDDQFLRGCNPLTGLFVCNYRTPPAAIWSHPQVLQSPYGAFCLQPRAQRERQGTGKQRGCNPLTGLFVCNRGDYAGNVPGYGEPVAIPLRGFLFATQGGGRRALLDRRKIVAIPLRGFLFATDGGAVCHRGAYPHVAIPLRGFLFATFVGAVKWAVRELLGLQSPYGAFCLQLALQE